MLKQELELAAFCFYSSVLLSYYRSQQNNKGELLIGANRLCRKQFEVEANKLKEAAKSHRNKLKN